MFKIGLPKAELLSMLKKEELTPELIADAIDRNNKKILEQVISAEFKEVVKESLMEDLLQEIRG